MRLDAKATLQKRRQLFSFENPAGIFDGVEQDGHSFLVELVGSLRPTLARQQSGQTFALEQCLSDIAGC